MPESPDFCPPSASGEPESPISWPPLVLASSSPRRRELLGRIRVRGIAPEGPERFGAAQFEVLAPTGVDESDARGSADERARHLAERKAKWVHARRSPRAWVIGADTLVVGPTAAGEPILGKPRDRNDACRTLALLSGREHRVVTGVAVISPDGRECIASESSAVVFRTLSEPEIDEYVATGEPDDKAGAYGIQAKGAALVKGFQGCFYNVVGLPLSLLAEQLRELGLDVEWTCDCAGRAGQLGGACGRRS